jgi:hypothetical protein
MLRAGEHVIDAGFELDVRQATRDKLAIGRLRLPGKLLFFLFRIRFGLYAVLSRLGASCDWSSLVRRFAEDSRRAFGVNPTA